MKRAGNLFDSFLMTSDCEIVERLALVLFEHHQSGLFPDAMRRPVEVAPHGVLVITEKSSEIRLANLLSERRSNLINQPGKAHVGLRFGPVGNNDPRPQTTGSRS